MTARLPLATALAFALSAVPVRAQDGDVDARLQAIEGEVTVYAAENPSEAVPASEDLVLQAGDRVVTGSDSLAEIGLEGESLVELGPNSDFTVSGLDRSETTFSLAAGSLLAKLKAVFSPRGVVRVRTPTAVAAVRGTEFGVESGGAETYVGVFDEGSVAVASADGGEETVLAANEETSVARGARPAAKRRLERFLRHRDRLLRVRGRMANLRKRWRSLSPKRRQELRKRHFERRKNIRERVQERRREMKRKGRRDGSGRNR